MTDIEIIELFGIAYVVSGIFNIMLILADYHLSKGDIGLLLLSGYSPRSNIYKGVSLICAISMCIFFMIQGLIGLSTVVGVIVLTHASIRDAIDLEVKEFKDE